MSMKMGTFHWIPKKDGRKRRIVVPTPHGKAANRHQLGLLHFLQQENCNPLVVHGFMRGKSPVTNAQRHIGYRWSVCFDLSDFFHSVTVQLFEKVVTRPIGYLFVDENCRSSTEPDARAEQGLPASPLVANLTAIPLDCQLVTLAEVYDPVRRRPDVLDERSGSCAAAPGDGARPGGGARLTGQSA